MIDLHCHLDLYPEPLEVIDECKKQGLYVLSVTTTPSAFMVTKKLSFGSNKIRTALGLHPQIAHERFSELSLFDSLVSCTNYIGEIGLDGSRDYKKYWQVQTDVFEHILDVISKAGGKIMSIHSRAAAVNVVKLLKKYPNAGLPILHWFSGEQKVLTDAIDFGAWFSVNSIMVKTNKGKTILRAIPKEKVLTETDGPFTMNGNSPLYPWDVIDTIEILSQIWGLSVYETNAQLYENLRKLTSFHKNNISEELLIVSKF